MISLEEFRYNILRDKLVIRIKRNAMAYKPCFYWQTSVENLRAWLITLLPYL